MTMLKIARRSLLLTGLAFAAGTLPAVPSGQAMAQPVQHIKIAHNMHDHHAVGVFFNVLAQEITERTKGTSVALNPQVFPDGQLYTDAQLPDALSTGGVHIGQLNLGFMAGRDAEAMRVWALPFLYPTWQAAWAAEDSPAFQELFHRQLRLYDQEMLGWASYGSVEIYANRPIRLPEDVKSLRIRSFGLDSTEYLNDIGASPLTMSSQEIYQAMQRGTIDSFSSGPSSVLTRSLFEVSPHGTNLGLSRLSFAVTASSMWWDTLPQDVQTAVREAAGVAQKAAREKMLLDSEAELQALREKGVAITDPTPEEVAAWQASAAPRLAAYREKVGAAADPVLAAVEAANAAHPAP